MTVNVKGVEHDTMAEACKRLDISRNTLLSYIKQGAIAEPPYVRKGKTNYRYFPEVWYVANPINVQKLDSALEAPLSDEDTVPDTTASAKSGT